MALTVSDKISLVGLAQQPNWTCYSVAKYHGISYPTIRKYRRKVQKGFPLFQRKGRPNKLDEESNRVLWAFMLENSGWDRSTLKRMVIDEAKNTAKRRFALGNPPAAAGNLSRTSVWRLTCKLIYSFRSANGPLEGAINVSRGGSEGDVGAGHAAGEMNGQHDGPQGAISAPNNCCCM